MQSLHFIRILYASGFRTDTKKLSYAPNDFWRRLHEAPKLWDGISSILVLFGLDLYGSCCWYGVWALVYAALGCVILGVLIAVRTQRCPFCYRYLGMMFFSGKKMYCPHCGSDVHADRNV